MDFAQLDKLLDRIPVLVHLNPVSLAFFEQPVTRFETAREMALLMDALEITEPARWLTLDVDIRYSSRFLEVTCEHDPFTPDLNKVLLTHFDTVARGVLCQSQIPARIQQECCGCDVIVLMIVDGLSYANCKGLLTRDRARIEPCLVDCPTVTEIAYLNTVGALEGQEYIAERLFDKGFRHRLGFTYWERDNNPLTNRLFKTFRYMTRVTEFSDLLSNIQQDGVSTPTYVQIVRTALDGYAHGQKRKPPLAALIDAVFAEFIAVADMLERLGRRAKIYLTADHGLLWRDEFTPELVSQRGPTVSPRYYEVFGMLTGQAELGKLFRSNGKDYYCLGYPRVVRPLRLDEQAVHGGISFQESIVPFITLEVN